MPQPNWFDAGNALLGAGTGLISGIKDLKDADRKRALELKEKGYEEDPEKGLLKTQDQKKKEAFERAEKQAGLLKSGFKAVYNPETGEADLQKIPGFKDTEQELKALQLQKAREEAAGPAALPPDRRMAKLSGQEKIHLDQTKNAFGAISKMADALKSGENTFSMVGDNNFTKAATTFENAIGRLESGGAISKDEGARYRSMGPKHFDPPEIKKQKLMDLAADMTSRLGTLGFKPSEVGVKEYDFNNFTAPQKGLLQSTKEVAGTAASRLNPFGSMTSAYAGQKPGPVVHTKESLSSMSDEQLRALAQGK